MSICEFHGSNLSRPECVLTTRAGNLYVSDFRGGVTQIASDGAMTFWGGEFPNLGLLQPNGICLLDDSSFLVAHLGVNTGGVYRVYRDQRIEPFLLEVAGESLPPTNFVYRDFQGRIWISVSTRRQPRALAYRSDVADGFIILVDENGARIVADDIGYTNEIFVTPDGKTLYCNATFSRETLAFSVGRDNTLSKRRTIARYGPGIFPDGLVMDEDENLWVTSIISNRVICVEPRSGQYSVVIEDADEAHVDWVEQAFKSHSLGRPHLDTVKSRQLSNISSLAFGGENLDRAFLGCLLGDAIAEVRLAAKGLAPPHWCVDG